MTVWLRHTNLYTCSACRSFEQAHLFVIHNDAVVQGLSEAANMKDVDHWGVFTIGTGLGNARFTNRK